MGSSLLSSFMSGDYRGLPELARAPVVQWTANNRGGIAPHSLLCKILMFSYHASATTKAAVQNLVGTTSLIGGRDSSRNLFLRLLFALDQTHHPRNKVAPRSMYVPTRASRGDSNYVPSAPKCLMWPTIFVRTAHGRSRPEASRTAAAPLSDVDSAAGLRPQCPIIVVAIRHPS